MKIPIAVLKIVTVSLATIAGILLVFSVIYSPEYVYRCLVWGVLKVEENRSYSRIDASPAAFHFASASTGTENEVKRSFAEIFHTPDVDAYLESTKTGAFVVIQRGQLLYEHYFNGYGRDSPFELHSATKSIVSALIGIALSEGSIHSIDDPVTRYIPELAGRDGRFDKMTVRHLLTMSSGIRFDNYLFFTADSSLSGAYPDLRYAATRLTKIVDEPGRRFVYNDFNPLLLGIILERAAGTSVSNYLEKRIWQPVGMEFDGLWALDSQQTGFEKMQGGLHVRAIDLAKFALVYLQKGAWNGQAILPESWVTQSTQGKNANVIGMPEGFEYGYLWWIMQGNNQPGDYYALGNFGQMVYVSPAKGLAIIRLGGGNAGADGWINWIKAASEFAGANL